MRKREKDMLRGMSDEELRKRIEAIEGELRKGTLGRKARGKRKERAFLKTIRRERTL